MGLGTVEYPAGNVTDREFDILEDAKKANPWWFLGMINQADIMRKRRYKHSGQQHPYFNFVAITYLMREENPDITMKDSFAFTRALKVSRKMSGSGDHADDTLLDNLDDGSNYNTLEAGWIRGGLTEEDVIPMEEWNKLRNNHSELKSLLEGLAEELGVEIKW